ncbi:MAG TPA: hypothetical protein DEE98_03735 [Elusimicrobia bacterium]|nr:MAG: hypothetical protein A2278_01065 [Elusimicrobia bacterium RIFOXYA12_FULL_49_49]OGS08174.1 MAG: hypothetical protein A2204_04800 [Elusimicrobia bacterium RIFOXYA1_FULL_47_7]OGS11208.1 MAG: hypothetical protein A2386_04590 [Elusimicrobia bacterium RIFOXYB1_FULL_48_9]OGS15787.1 MAG: hypothetical protein A2251_03965 [Elusimicrobia bacterium RIFOXYA2_FULL_47_53]OGS25976.1 MAG: hypothetical protein A2339_05360 [Elusimicrobia bacterium RIFOXYB12_FULL_50_12]OGS31120.1 MAG: hypothetical protein
MAYGLNDYLDALKKNLGGELESVILYGSKAFGEELKGSDHNLLVVLGSARPELMEKLHSDTLKWTALGNRPPMFFTAGELRGACDVFPIEFNDIKEKHKVLHGSDVAAGLKVENTHLRHECEYELRGKLLKLRQSYIMSAGKPGILCGIMADTVSSVAVLFRHVVTLFGEKAPEKKYDSFKVLSARTGIDAAIFEEIIRLRNGAAVKGASEAGALMGQYMSQIEKVIKAVDEIK